jgi:hypothetical protein
MTVSRGPLASRFLSIAGAFVVGGAGTFLALTQGLDRTSADGAVPASLHWQRMTGHDVERQRTRASRRRFKEGQLRPVLRPMAAGGSVLLILVGWLVLLLTNLGGPRESEGPRIGWSLVGVGSALLLWAVLSSFAERRRRARAREERARSRDSR